MSAAGAKGRILVVDDDAALLRATSAVLRHHGYEVESCATVAEALAALDVQTFDVALTDLDLGADTGLDLLRGVADRRIHLAAIIITGKPSTASAIEALRLSAVDYLLKPFDPRDLVARIARAAEKTHALRTVAQAQRGASEIARTLEALRGALDLPGLPAALATSAPSAPSAPSDPLRRLRDADRALLSARELDVLACVAEGRSPKETATQLGLSTHTVRNHLRSIYTKLGVHSQLELFRRLVD